MLVSELLDYHESVERNEAKCESVISEYALHHLTRIRRTIVHLFRRGVA
jgi:hypothetical protein